MKPNFHLSGKVALVTGVTHGLGMGAMAKALVCQGYTLVVNRNTPEKMKAVFAQPYKSFMSMGNTGNYWKTCGGMKTFKNKVKVIFPHG